LLAAYGATANDNTVEAMNLVSLYGNFGVTFANLTDGGKYKVQIIMQENWVTEGDPGRRGTYVLNGTTLVSGFDYIAAGGSLAGGNTGIVITETIRLTGTTSLLLAVTGTGNPVVNMMTIEAVPEPATLAVLGLGGLVALRRRNRRA